jgi:N-acylneuraminate cytidylyltransferase
MSTLCIIPARGGSKRIPRKNLKDFRGRPIIAYSIEAALASGVFHTVMVSTDDSDIADVARFYGAQVPFMRSAATADDHATTADVLLETLEGYRKRGLSFDIACNLYPTAPFVTADDLKSGFNTLSAGPFDVVLPVVAFSYPILRSLNRADNGKIDMNWPEHMNSRSQDLPKAFHDAGQWAFFKTEPFLQTKTLLGPNTGSVVLPESRVQDIDTLDDWAFAELKHQILFGASS